MKRLSAIILTTAVMLLFPAAAAFAHPQDPPGQGDGVGFIPAEQHHGIECGHRAGAPPFPSSVGDICPAQN